MSRAALSSSSAVTLGFTGCAFCGNFLPQDVQNTSVSFSCFPQFGQNFAIHISPFDIENVPAVITSLLKSRAAGFTYIHIIFSPHVVKFLLSVSLAIRQNKRPAHGLILYEQVFYMYASVSLRPRSSCARAPRSQLYRCPLDRSLL